MSSAKEEKNNKKRRLSNGDDDDEDASSISKIGEDEEKMVQTSKCKGGTTIPIFLKSEWIIMSLLFECLAWDGGRNVWQSGGWFSLSLSLSLFFLSAV